jgi:hypothetical protein
MIEHISDDLDESLPIEQRKEARLNIMQDIDKVSKMDKEEAERYMAEQNMKAIQQEEEE